MQISELKDGDNVVVKNKNLSDVKIPVPGGDDVETDGFSVPGTIRKEDDKVYFDREGKDPVELTDDFEVKAAEETEDDSE